MSKNIRATSDGMEYPNANGTQTHVNANTSATTDVYIQLPSSSGTLALAADTGTVLSADLSAPYVLTGTGTAVTTLPAITTSGIYKIDLTLFGEASTGYDRTRQAGLWLDGSTATKHNFSGASTTTAHIESSGSGAVITDVEDYSSSPFAYVENGVYTQSGRTSTECHLYLDNTVTVKLMMKQTGGTTGTFTVTVASIKATLIQACTI